MAIIGVISPGEMGTGIARAAQDNFHEIIWASEDRSENTRARADRYGFRDVGTLEAMALETKYILCVGVDYSHTDPHWSVDTLDRVGKAGFRGVYCDANTKPAERKRDLEMYAEAHGISYIDGAIFGNPPPQGKVVRGYISDTDWSEDFASIFGGPASTFRWIPIKGDPQYLKMVFSACIGAFNSVSTLANRALEDPELSGHLINELQDGAFDFRTDGRQMGLFPGW